MANGNMRYFVNPATFKIFRQYVGDAPDPFPGMLEVPTACPDSVYGTWNPGTQQWDLPVDLATQQATDAVSKMFPITGTDDRVARTLFEILFNMNNRIRTLEGQAPLTRAATRTLLVQLYQSA